MIVKGENTVTRLFILTCCTMCTLVAQMQENRICNLEIGAQVLYQSHSTIALGTGPEMLSIASAHAATNKVVCGGKTIRRTLVDQDGTPLLGACPRNATRRA